ncbi:hypothetical protein PMIN01_00038 [Paraphaeosphaeria minitans]|uniref:Uncharacterized protein n=1 Tax=Paraphaeosphaeria minitans TaxID=565426 RepID=A0A9P6KW29_9PLEO|nr:hypothetical protein PMIN01_00038 [Paraphaeosphaeria minitans]
MSLDINEQSFDGCTALASALDRGMRTCCAHADRGRCARRLEGGRGPHRLAFRRHARNAWCCR